MTTMGDLTEKVRSMVRGSLTEQLSALDEAYDAGSGVVKLRYPNAAVKPGSLISCGLNTWYVLTVSTDGKSLEVMGSADGGPDQDLPEATRVNVKPQHTTWSIFRELHDEIIHLASPRSGIYQPISFEAFVNHTSGVYELPQDWQDDTTQPMRLIQARFRDPVVDDWSVWPAVEWLPERWTVQVRGYPPTTRLEFVFAFPFRPPQSLADDVALLGLTEKTTQDIPTLGAAAALLLALEGRRAQPFAQGDSRRAEEVVAGSNSSLADRWLREQRNRIGEEKTRLTALFGYTRPIMDVTT